MSAGIAPISAKTTTPRIRIASAQAFDRLGLGAPALEVKGGPVDMGRRAGHFEELEDDDLLGQYKRAAYELDGILVYLQFFRYTDDGTMTLYVDLQRCVEKAVSPLALAKRALDALGLAHLERTFVHTHAEELFWQQVDPLALLDKL